MLKDLDHFVEQLEQAAALLDQYTGHEYPQPQFNPDLVYVPPEKVSLTLFEDLPDLFGAEVKDKPIIRVVHQLACTGGTIISRCLAALPNVAMLSEANPASRERARKAPFFSPTDITALAIYGKFPELTELSHKIFQADISVLQKHTRTLGKYLLIRDHSQTDYLSDRDNSEINGGTIRNLLVEQFELLSIITVRHPVDSYLSLQHEQWVRFSPATFDEYCRRYLLFLAQNSGLPIFKYEDFLRSPETEIEQMSKKLAIPYSEDFLDIFEVYQLTGNSGRVSSNIGNRKRRKFNAAFQTEANNSKNYRKLCKQLRYEARL